MGFYWIKTHTIIKRLFKKYIWDLPNQNNSVYLTFDDGPTPEITNWVLDELAKNNIKATFFCIGKNILENPVTYSRILNEGHVVGNHTNNHLNGWKTSDENYLENIGTCQKIIDNNKTNTSKLFRPPYGKIRRNQGNQLLSKEYKIIMWDVLSADFDRNISPDKCLNNVVNNVKSGSVIVFHDSLKAAKNLQYALPKTIAYLLKNEFNFEVIK